MKAAQTTLLDAFHARGGHDHLGAVCRNDAEIFDAISCFFKVGLERRERCLLAVSGDPEAAVAALEARFPEMRSAHETGALLVEREEAFLDPTLSFTDTLMTALDNAREEGYSALRFSGRLIERLFAEGHPGPVAGRNELNAFFLQNRASGLCIYGAEGISPARLLEMTSIHTHMLYGGMLYKNPWHHAMADGGGSDAGTALRLLDLASERERIETALHDSENKYRQMMDQAGDIILLVDGEGKMVEANRKAFETLGYTQTELMAMELANLHSHDDLPRLMSAIYTTENKGSGHFDNFSLKTKAGTALPVDATVTTFSFGGRNLVKVVYRDASGRMDRESVLRMSQDFYRQMFEQNNAVKLLIDPETGNIVDANPAAADFYGYPQEDLRKMRINRINTLPMERIEEEMQKAKVERRTYFNFRHRLATGELRDVEVYSGPVTISGRTLLFSIIHDITARKRAETALKEGESRYRTLVEILPDPLVVHSGGFVRYANTAAATAFGAENGADLIGRRVLDQVDPASRPLVMERMRRMQESGGPLPMVREKFLRVDGTPFDVEVVAMPMQFEDQPAFMVAFRDITERLRSEDELRQSEEKYHLLFDNSMDALLLTDAESHRIIDANLAFLRLYGYELEELRAMTAEAINAEPDASHGPLDAPAGGNGAMNAPFRMHRKKDGTVFPVELTGSPYIWQGRGVIFAAIRDISARVAAERQLMDAKERAEKATEVKEKLVSLVSHDLRGPLAASIGYLKLLLEDASERSDGQMAGLLRIALDGNEKMSVLIDELLSANRLQSGRFMLHASFVPLRPLATRALSTVAYSASAKQIALANNVPEDARIYADQPLLYQVLQNLLSNAIKFSPTGGSIAIGFSGGDPAAVSISDTGVGIDPARVEKLFHYETRVSTPGTAGETGTGLGLPLCMDIAHAHGGTITVASEPGRGSTFRVMLPTPRPLILVVDDDDAGRELIKAVLKKFDTGIATAEDGREALARIEAQRPNLVLTDLYMPGMDGFELIKALKGTPALSGIPVIALTGVGYEDRERVAALGADEFVLKTALPGNLAEVVKKFLP